MARRLWLAAALFGATSSLALAQPAPFDMTPESGLRTPPPAAPEQVPGPSELVPVEPQPVVPASLDRYLLPVPTIRLTGEESAQAIVVYLTQAQAAAPAHLALSYINAIVVAPEVSNLRVRVNDTEVLSRPISSSASPSAVLVDLPEGVLRAGANTIVFSASQRHRTDCSVESTYQLWTELTADTTKLILDGSDLGQIGQIGDLAAVGVDTQGVTNILLLTQDFGNSDIAKVALDLAQNLSLALHVPRLHFEKADALSDAYSAGQIDVVMTTADQLPPELADWRGQAASGPYAGLVSLPSGAVTLVVSGPDWASVSRASALLAQANPAGPQTPRIDLPYVHPQLSGGDTLALSDLGVRTVQFNGRRFASNFQFDLPPDFYADRYGEAELVLDAAYSADVLPGSEIDIYTNNQIASATPLLRTDGGLLRDTAIRIPMTNLRAGRNDIDVEVKLITSSDAVCSAGWTGQAPTRFVFSAGSQLRLPSYARAVSLPDLSVFTGSAWPYVNDASVPVVLGGGDQVMLSAMTLLARVSASTLKVLPIDIQSEAELSPASNALVIVPADAMSQPTLQRSGLSRGGPGQSDDSAVLDQFGGANPTGPFAEGFAWLLQQIGLTIGDVTLVPPPDDPYRPAEAAAVLSQAVQPEGGVWTVLSAASASTMLDGVERLSAPGLWRQIGGRISAAAPSDETVSTLRPNRSTLIQTQPLNFANLRLVAANWFSINLLGYTGIIILAALALMIATSVVIKNVGRNQ